MKLLVTALAVARLLAAAEYPLAQLLPPDAAFVFGIRVRALTESPVFRTNSSDARAMSENWLKLAALTGFDPLRDVDECWLASTSGRENAPTLMLLRGRFNLEKLGAGAERYHGIALAHSGAAGASVLALLDAATALTGDSASVRAAIDRLAGPVPAATALSTRAQALNSQFDLWGAGERPQGFAAPAVPADQLDAIDRFELGIRLTRGLDVSAEFHARSQAGAGKLTATLESLQAMLRTQGPQSPQFHIEFHDNTWKIAFSISEAELQKAIATQRAGLQAPRPASQLAPQPAPVARPMTVIGGEPAAAGPPAASGTTIVTLPRKQ